MKVKFIDITLGLVFALAFIKPASPQVIPDNSLGKDNSIVNPSTPNTDIINGGVTRGSNLFHSFQEFSIPTGKGVIFNNAPNIENIISRITGQNISNINGLIQASGKANLFLLNPNGITFGTSAHLNIGGSFFASTASELRFTDGSIFSVNPTQSLPLLTVSTPIGLQLGARENTRGNITNSGNLSVNPQKSITLVGSKINQNGTLVAPGGDIYLAGLNLNISPNSQINTSSNTSGGKISIGSENTQSIYVDKLATIQADALTSGNGGEIKVLSTDSTQAYGSFSAKGGFINGNGGLIETSGQKFLDVAGITVDATAANGLAGNWLLDPTNITLVNTPTTADNTQINIQDIERQLNAGTNVTIRTNSAGSEAGNITAESFGINKISDNTATLTLQAANDINLKSFSITSNNGSLGLIFEADSDNSGQGNINISSGSINTNGGIFQLTAADTISLEAGTFGSNNRTNSPAEDITVKADNVTFKASLNSFTFTSQPGANINVDASKKLTIDVGGINNISSGDGKSGSINVNAGNIFINRGSLRTGANQRGNAGDVNIVVDNDFTAQSSGLGSDINQQSTANSGNVTVKTNTLNLNNSALRSNARVQGTKGGNININANSITTNSSNINTITFGDGDGGNINIRTDSLALRNTQGIIADAGNVPERVRGNAGNINITAKSIELTDTVGINSQTLNEGNAGNIKIKTDSLLIEKMSGIITNSASPIPQSIGKGGNIEILADSITIKNSAGIGSNTITSGNSGDIKITTRSLTLKDEQNLPSPSNISTNTGIIPAPTSPKIERQSTGNAGTINISSDFISIDNAQIIGEIISLGRGGEINIKANTLQLRNRAEISTSASSTPSRSPTNAATFSSNSPNLSNSVVSNGPAAGSINIIAKKLFVDNSSIKGTAEKINGGNITLNIDSILLLQNISDISTNAGNRETPGNGGNITIKTPLLVATPNDNSDITANAFSGRGGKIDITTNSFFGLEIRPQLTGLSDITAFSQIDPSLNGRVQINSLNIDPTHGSITLPNTVVDQSTLIASSCTNLGNENQSQFTYTGRGGLPPSPDDLQTSDVIWEDNRIALRQQPINIDNTRVEKQTHRHIQEKNNIPTPATSWIFDNKGQVRLISQNYNRYNLGANQTPCLKLGG
jgi:filamentous hemagglutinin family protein